MGKQRLRWLGAWTRQWSAMDAVYRTEDRETLPRAWRLVFRVWHVARLTWNQYSDQRLDERAAGLTYTTVLSLVPVFVVVGSIANAAGLLSNGGAVVIERLIASYTPVERDTVSEFIQRLVSNASATYAGLAGLAVTLYTSVMLFEGTERLLNDIWHVDRRRRFWRRMLLFWTLLTLAPPLLVASILGTTRVQYVLQTTVGGFAFWESMTNALFPILLSTVGMLVTFRLLPNTVVSWREAAISAASVAIVLEVGKFLFGWYVATILSESWFRIYGAIFLLPVLLLWIQLNWQVITIGAVMNWVLQNFWNVLRGETLRRPIGDVAAHVVWDCLACVVSSFKLGEGGPTTTEIANALHLKTTTVGPALDALAAAGFIERAEEPSSGRSLWFLRRPPEELTLEGIAGTLQLFRSTSGPVRSDLVERRLVTALGGLSAADLANGRRMREDPEADSESEETDEVD